MSEVYCRQCGVTDDEHAKCHGCDTLFPHDELIHYDGYGVFCQECDEWVEEDLDDEIDA